MTERAETPGSFPEPAREKLVGESPAESSEEVPRDSAAPRWRLPAALFVATALSVFLTGAEVFWKTPSTPLEWEVAFSYGWQFAVPLMSILLVHEFGHYIAARIHRVEASLPYFLPLPGLSPFGTMGAVIAMRGKIRSRNALLDIGASGPLAGLAVAIPVLIVGLSLSKVMPVPPHGLQEGQSLLYLLLKRLVLGPMPQGSDVFLHPTAFAGWAGLLVTMLNLLPWGQLDGGHVAYALFGTKQNRYARWFRFALIPLALGNALVFAVPLLVRAGDKPVWVALLESAWWLIWFMFLSVIARLSGGADHPPVEAGELSPKRRIIAWFTLALFVLLFIPTHPLTAH